MPKSAPYPPLDPHEMRITFMGSVIPPVQRAQQMMSIFVEVGWDEKHYRARDSFVFDCGSGVCANYGAMDVGFAFPAHQLQEVPLARDHP